MYKWGILIVQVIAQGGCALFGIGDDLFGAGMVAGTSLTLVLVHAGGH
jgi:hypothetical protein